MADLAWQGQPEPASLRRALRHALRQRAPELRVVAEDVLAEVSTMDLLAVGDEGELVSIRIAPDERDGADSRLLTSGLADLTWLRPRAADLIKLAPGLGLEPDAEPRAILVATHFGAEVVAAAENLPGRVVELMRWRGLRQQGQLVLLLEPEKPPLADVRMSETEHRRSPASRHVEGGPAAARRAAAHPSRATRPAPGRAAAPPGQRTPLIDPPSASTFRTGLTDEDLQLEPRAAEI